MATIKATVFFEKRFWVGTFERTDKEGYTVARHIFGSEPSDPEIYEFVLNNYHELKSHLQKSRWSLFRSFHKFAQTMRGPYPKGYVNLHCLTRFAKTTQKID